MGENFTAFLLGQAVRRSMGAAKTPVAYLYNGVRLPKLPEWDKSKYPYAYITNTLGVFFAVYVAEKIEHGYNSGSNTWCVRGTCIASYDANNGGQSWTPVDGASEQNTGIVYVQWANFKVLNSDGSSFLPASTPIPVYE